MSISALLKASSKYFLFLFLFCPRSAFSSFPLDQAEVHLKEPTFQEGVLETTQGGVILAEGVRIQAERIRYIDQTVSAEGNLLLEYGDNVFVGSRLEFDLKTRTGFLLEGRAAKGPWVIGGDRIELKADGTYVIYGAFLTTCIGQERSWDIHAESVKVTENHLVKASNIRLHLFHIPALWLPSFKTNLTALSDPPLRYKMVWDKGLGPRLSLRYRFLSWEDLNLFFRLDYRLTKGPGAALESEYFSPDQRTTFVTRSYGAYDKEVFDEHGLKRYRLQGLLSHESLDEKTTMHLTYDKYHDLKMISDFPSSDFEINTQKRTQLLVRHQEEIAYAALRVEPRLNPFESLNQKLPLLKLGIRPLSIGHTGILSENAVNVGYLDYVYAHELIKTYPTLHETHATRLATKNRLYRPLSMGPLQLTPSLGVLGIFYTNNPSHVSVGQGVFTYGGSASLPLYRNYSSLRHMIKPYLDYEGFSHPKAHLSQHYTFLLEDGLYQLNSLKMGLANTLFFPKGPLSWDLYTYAFFHSKTFNLLCPKGYLSVVWSQPMYILQTNTCWNFEERLLDFCNTRGDITFNDQFALSLEVRHRSRFDWRKADHENFFVDMARSIPELEDSPLSDKRDTFLSTLHIHLTPKWSCHFTSHYGWGRLKDPAYHSFKFDLLTLLTNAWRFKISYTHTTNDDRISTQIQLIR